MIHIKETIPDNKTVVILVDGTIDDEGLEVLEEVCRKYLANKKNEEIIRLNLNGLVSINRKGMSFLKQLKDVIRLENLPNFIQF